MSIRNDHLVDAMTELSVEVSRLPDSGQRRLVNEARQLAATIARRRNLDAKEYQSLVRAADMFGAPFAREDISDAAVLVSEGRIAYAIGRTTSVEPIPLKLNQFASNAAVVMSPSPCVGELEAADPDADIIHLVATGNTGKALQLLIQRHGRSIYRYCYAALGDTTYADDVHQQVLIEANRELPTLRAALWRGRGCSRSRTIAYATPPSHGGAHSHT